VEEVEQVRTALQEQKGADRTAEDTIKQVVKRVELQPVNSGATAVAAQVRPLPCMPGHLPQGRGG
jgi:hypothetical protein